MRQPSPDRPFVVGDFVFDAKAPWDDLRSGIVQDVEGCLSVWFPARNKAELKNAPKIIPLDTLADRMKLHLLQSLVLRGDAPAGWSNFYNTVLRTLRDAPCRELPLANLQASLRADPAIDDALIEDGLRMMATMGVAEVKALKSGLVYASSELIADGFREVDHLSTFSEELLVKSRRIDLLLNHRGTVGSYREELLRSLLTQILPKQYEATTGFIQGCARQLDIIVWDAANFSPLFREQNFVVVPLEAVRAVIEVKTTLSSGSLWEALEILRDTFRHRQTPAPIFKAVFAYETDYASDAGVAKRMVEFYRATDADGLIAHEHDYPWAGASAVCVPKAHMLRERYEFPADETRDFPQPILTSVASDTTGDTQTPLFLALLLTHLDSSAPAKRQAAYLFNPVVRQLENVALGPIYEDWRPRSVRNDLGAVLTPGGCNQYVRNVHAFRAGELSKEKIVEDLGLDPVQVPAVTHPHS